MKIVSDPIKTSSFFSLNSKTSSSTPIYTHFESYIESPKKGRLFGILNLNTSKDVDCFKCTQILKSLIVSKFYNGQEKSLIDDLEYTIADIKSELSQMVSLRRDQLEGSLDLNCLLVSVRDNTCYIANFGDNEIFLVRDGKEYNLNIHLRDTLGRNQVRVASILLNERDLVYIATPSILNKIIDSKLRNCIDTFNFEKLDLTPLKNDTTGLGIFSFGYRQPVAEIIPPDVPQAINTPVVEKVKPTLYPAKNTVPHQEKMNENNVDLDKETVSSTPENVHQKINEKIIPNAGNSEPHFFNDNPIQKKEPFNNEINSQKNVIYEHAHNNVIDHEPRDNNNFQNQTVFEKVRDERKSNAKTNEKFVKNSDEEYLKLLNSDRNPQRNNFSHTNELNIGSKIKQIPNITSGIKDITFFNTVAKLYKTFSFRLVNLYNVVLTALLRKRTKSFEKKIRAERFESSMKKFNTPLKPKPSKRNINLKIAIPVLVAIIIFLSFFISNSMRIESEKRSKEQILTSTQNLVDDAKKLISESEKYAGVNKQKARDLLAQAEVSLKEAESKSLVEFNSKIDELRKNSQIIIDKKIEKNIILDDTNVVQDISSIFQSPTISGMEISNGRIYIGLKDGRLLESGAQITGNLSFINVLQNLEKINIDKISQDADGNILLYDSKIGLYRYDTNLKTLSKVTNMTSTVIGNASTFLTAKINTREYLYFFNPLTKDLFRALRSTDGYNNPDVRIHDESFDQATSLSIDGRIWVATRGTIKKFYDANEEPVKFNQTSFDFPLTRIMNIKVTNDRVILSDDGAKRVVVFSKVEALTENSLKYITSYILKSKSNADGFNAIIDFEFQDGFIYILDSKKLYRASYQIPQEYLN